MPRKPWVYIKITKKELAKLFNVSIHTINNWIWNNKIDPYSLKDIVSKYNNRYLLDRRMKKVQ